MVDTVKISELLAATTDDGTNYMPVVQGGVTKRETSTVLLNNTNTAIGNINSQISSLQSSVTGLGTTLSGVVTDLNTPQTGQLFAANSGEMGAVGTPTYPLQYLSDAFSLTPPIVPSVTNPWVVNAAPGYYSDPGSPFAIIPYLSYRGDPAAPPSLELIVTGSFTLGNWTGGGVATLENFSIVNGGIDLDFFTSSYSGTVNLKNITTGSSGIVRVFGTDSSVTFVNVDNLKTTVTDPIFDGVYLQLKNSKLTGVSISGNNANSVAVIDALETTSDGIYLQATMATVAAQITNCPNNEFLTIDGTAITVSIDSISLEAVGGLAGITYLNSATLAQVTILGASSGSVLTTGMRWFAPDGNDDADGGSQSAPWGKISYGMATFSPVVDPCAFVLNAGNYSDSIGTDILCTPNKTISGQGLSNTFIGVAPGVYNWSLDATSWNGVNGTIEFNNFQTDSSIAWDFASAGATGSTSYIVNFKTNLGVNVIGNDKTTDTHYSNDSFLGGNSYFQNVTAYWNNVQAMGQMYINAAGGNVYARITSCNFPSAGNTLIASPGDSLYARIETTILPFLTINGTDVQVDMDLATYSQCSFTFAGGATSAQVNILGSTAGVSGTWTPTLTNTANITSSTAGIGQWMQIGNTVFFHGSASVTSTLTATTTKLGVSLPVASTFAAVTDATGDMLTTNAALATGGIEALVAGTLEITWFTSTQVAGQNIKFSGSYQVI